MRLFRLEIVEHYLRGINRRPMLIRATSEFDALRRFQILKGNLDWSLKTIQEVKV